MSCCAWSAPSGLSVAISNPARLEATSRDGIVGAYALYWAKPESPRSALSCSCCSALVGSGGGERVTSPPSPAGVGGGGGEKEPPPPPPPPFPQTKTPPRGTFSICWIWSAERFSE